MKYLKGEEMKKKQYRSWFGGGIVGIFNGLLGGGGGMIAVPILQKAGKLNARSAHATAIAVILPASLVSGIIYLLGGFTPLSVLVPVAIGVTAGGYLGAKLLNGISSGWVTLLFSALMLAAGLRMLFG